MMDTVRHWLARLIDNVGDTEPDQGATDNYIRRERMILADQVFEAFVLDPLSPLDSGLVRQLRKFLVAQVAFKWCEFLRLFEVF